MRIETLEIFPRKNRPEETVSVIRQLVLDSRKSAAVRSLLEDSLEGLPEHNDTIEILRIFDTVRGSIRYVQDPVDLEFVKSPSFMAKWLHENPGKMLAGDCDDHVVLLASLLTSAGYKTKLVIVRTPGGCPDGDYNHIYLKVFAPLSEIADGDGWISLDPIVKAEQPGWEVESDDMKEFDI